LTDIKRLVEYPDMNAKSKIARIQKQLSVEQSRFEKRKDELQAQLDPLYEELAGFKKGDKIKVSSIKVRDRHRDSDIAILGKTGVVVKVEGNWITAKIDGSPIICGCPTTHGFYIPDNSLEKLNTAN